MRAEQVTGPVAHHGEGPVWITGTAWPDGLHWVDMLAGDVLRLGDDATVVRRHVGDVAAVIRPRATGGGLVYAIERGFALDEGPGSEPRPMPPLWTDASVRMNEGGCDPAGNLWCGSMASDAAAGRGVLYVLHPDHTVTTAGTGYTIPNGLAWTAAGDRAYHVDTPTGRVDVLDWSPEEGLHHRRPFAVVEGGDPDGLTLDADGGVWVAVWGGRAVHRYDADGVLSAVVELPVAQVSACAFGGADLDRLYVTTSREGLAEPEPAAGAVFAVDVGVRGLPVRAFGG